MEDGISASQASDFPVHKMFDFLVLIKSKAEPSVYLNSIFLATAEGNGPRDSDLVRLLYLSVPFVSVVEFPVRFMLAITHMHAYIYIYLYIYIVIAFHKTDHVCMCNPQCSCCGSIGNFSFL